MRNKTKHILTIAVLAVFMAAGMTAAAGFETGDWSGIQPVSAASKPALSKDTLTLSIGNTAKLTVKKADKKVKWISGNKEMVTIQKTKGKYRKTAILQAGDQEGSCIVKAKLGKRVLKCEVTVLNTSSGEPEMTLFKKGMADFAFNLLKETLKQEKKSTQNILISPQSAATAIAMAELGASGDVQGGNREEMEALLSGVDEGGKWPNLNYEEYNQCLSEMNFRLAKINSDDAKYVTANSIWADDQEVVFKDKYKELVKALHDADIRMIDTSSVDTVDKINNWVHEKSQGRINDFITELTEDTRALLINVITFDGKWAEQFSEDQIEKEGTFENIDGTKASVRMLNGTIASGLKPYIQVAGAEGFVKLYAGGEIAFVGLLPPEGSSADDYAATLTGGDFLKGWQERSDEYDVELKLPSFKITYDVSMKEMLQNLGMKLAFTNSDKTFIEMAETSLKISDVLQKTYMKVDENGTEAAAATGVVMEKVTSAGPSVQKEVKKIYLDRPFVYALVDTETGIPLFIGTQNYFADLIK